MVNGLPEFLRNIYTLDHIGGRANRAAKRLVIRFVKARLKVATHLLWNWISRIAANRTAKSELINAAMTMGGAGLRVQC
jgi:hypothetical protein